MDVLVAQNRAALLVLREGKSKARGPKVRSLAGSLLTQIETATSEVERLRSYRYPKLPPYPDLEGVHASSTVQIRSGSEPYDERWLQAMLEQQKATLHLAYDYQNKLADPQLQATVERLIADVQASIVKLSEARDRQEGGAPRK